MFGFGSPFTSPTSFYRPGRYGGFYGQPSCRCPDCYYGSGAPYSSPATSMRRSRPPAEFEWPFSTPYTGAYGPTDRRTLRRPTSRPARKESEAPSRKDSSVATARGVEGGELAHSLPNEAGMAHHNANRSPRGRSVESEKEPEQDNVAQKPLLDTNEEQHFEGTLPEELRNDSDLKVSCSDSEYSSDSTHEGPGDNSAMDDSIPAGDSPSLVPQPEDNTLRLATLSQIAELSEQANKLQKPAMSFTGEAGSKEYLFLSESLMDLLLKLDLIESNGDKEVRDARRSAVVMIQEVLGLLESRAMNMQVDLEVALSAANGDGSQENVDGAEQEENRQEAMMDDITEQTESEEEAMTDNVGEQEENKEETMNDDVTEQDDNEAEVLNDDIAERGENEKKTVNDKMTEEEDSQEEAMNRSD